MLRQITPEKAVEVLLDLPVRLREERVPLDGAWGRVLARDVRAALPVPPFARSPFDGYALRAEDTRAASETSPVTLEITEEIAAGRVPAKAVGPGRAAKILTGAPVPEGADCVVKYEWTSFTRDAVTLRRPFPPGNVIPAGEDLAAGALAAGAGTVINSGVLGLLAGQGYDGVPVWRRPGVALVSTGSELTRVGEALAPGKIYGANGYSLGGILQEAGAVPEDGGTVPDDPAVIAERVRFHAGRADMVLMTGGASAGDYDFAPAALKLAGAELLFQKVRCRPGGAMLAGVLGETLVLCLSGSPGAAAAGLLRVGLPYVRKLCGRADLRLPRIRTALRRPYEKESTQTRLVWGRLEIEDGRAFFAQSGVQGSGGISPLARCDLLAEIPAGTPPLPAGALVTAYRITG